MDLLLLSLGPLKRGKELANELGSLHGSKPSHREGVDAPDELKGPDEALETL